MKYHFNDYCKNIPCLEHLTKPGTMNGYKALQKIVDKNSIDLMNGEDKHLALKIAWEYVNAYYNAEEAGASEAELDEILAVLTAGGYAHLIVK